MTDNQDDDTSALEYIIAGLVTLSFGGLYYFLNQDTDADLLLGDRTNTVALHDNTADLGLHGRRYADLDTKAVGIKGDVEADAELDADPVDVEVNDETLNDQQAEIDRLKAEAKKLREAEAKRRAEEAERLKAEAENRLKNANTQREQTEAEKQAAEEAARRRAEAKRLLDEQAAINQAEIDKLNAEIEQLHVEEEAARIKADKAREKAIELLNSQPKSNTNDLERAILEKKANASVVFDDINFDSGSSTLSADSLKQTEAIAKLLNKHKDTNILIRGHTDNVGPKQQNTLLSIERSKSMKNELIKEGVNQQRIKIEGVGPLEPIASNDTDEGREKNRRIELIILE